jgi:hypothetical protein
MLRDESARIANSKYTIYLRALESTKQMGTIDMAAIEAARRG